MSEQGEPPEIIREAFKVQNALVEKAAQMARMRGCGVLVVRRGTRLVGAESSSMVPFNEVFSYDTSALAPNKPGKEDFLLALRAASIHYRDKRPPLGKHTFIPRGRRGLCICGWNEESGEHG